MGEPQVPRTSACRFCDATSIRPVYTVGMWTTARCRSCGHYSTVPWPTAAELDAAYASEYYRRRGMWADDSDAAARQVAALSARVALLERFQQPPGRLIEIGAAMGPLVVAARARGWDAIGYDTSSEAVAAGARAYGDVVRHGDIETARSQESPADILAAYHVIEHVPDPRAFLAHARALLRDQGLLVIEVPHIGSFDARWLSDVRADVLDMPCHLTHYTPDTLGDLLAQHGFPVVQVDMTTSQLVHRLRRRLAGRSDDSSASVTPIGGRPGLLPRLARRAMPGGSFCIYARRSGSDPLTTPVYSR